MSVIVLLKEPESFAKLVSDSCAVLRLVLQSLFLEQNLTDVSFTGRRSFLSLGPIETEPTKLSVEFELRPLTNRGLVLFVGRQAGFVCLLLHSSFLELTLRAGLHKIPQQAYINTFCLQ